eukprot:TRINITY_DN29507_c0_g1_i1.p1 TRINITY_DN29507_c0_g1~~TRINITY_DN29507_c0_g1_i1.p1  ORF type:complete len:416 (-),score=122.28 TRINITY_DN29507_c0_g1_i1:24-1271(-)
MNPKRLISLLCSITTTLFFMWMMYRSDPPQAGSNIHYPGYKNCMKKQKVGFLKTHKCASSSLQNILMRYGVNNKLNFVLPSAGNYLGRYVKYSRSMIANTPWERAGMDYQIFCLHTIWNYKEVSQTLGSDTTYITIIRDPVELFESLWVYAGMDSYYNTDLETFALSPKTGIFAKRAFNNLGRNQMLWDSGLRARYMDNITAVRHKIEEMEDTFDLVLMAERFDESMILLKNKLCWDYEDVVNFKLNARKESRKTILSPEAKSALKEYLASDYLLYEHFKAKFEAEVDKFGLPKMSHELSILRHANENMKSKCDLKAADNDKIVGANRLHGQGMVAYTADEAADPECKLFSFSEMNFIDELRDVQSERAAKIGQKMNMDLESVDEQVLRQSMKQLPFNMEGFPDIEKMKALYIHN